jgi:thioredoxin reductase (NADPH)
MGGMSVSLDLSRLQKAKPAESQEDAPIRDLIIIGAGPAGLTAGLYAGRAQLKPLILVGQSLGGQAATTSEMENYPGFPEGIGGMALSQQMADQATRFGAEIRYEEVTKVDLSADPFVIETHGPTYLAKSIVICTGTSPRKLGVPGEARFIGHGVSFCATCDGFFYKDKRIIVVGGGDSAIDEALFLTRFAQEVTIIHRRDRLRAGAILEQRARDNPKIRFVWNTVVEEILGENAVRGVLARNVHTDETTTLEADGVFMYVGLLPNTWLFKGQLELNAEGYIVTDKRQRTSVPGVYAAGDVQDPWFRQTVVAAGAGAAAAIEAARYLSEKAFEEEAEAQAQAEQPEQPAAEPLV